MDSVENKSTFDLIEEAKMTSAQLEQAYDYIKANSLNQWFLKYDRKCVIERAYEFGSDISPDQNFTISESGSEIPFWGAEASAAAAGSPADKYVLASLMFGHVANGCNEGAE